MIGVDDMKKLFIAAALFVSSSVASADQSGIAVDTQPCPFNRAEYVLPSITATPWADVVVDLKEEFSIEKKENGLKLTHVGDAVAVRVPSVVSVFSSVEIELKSEGKYCFDSLVGQILIESNGADTIVHSAVGNTTIR